jgi:hypothetical protein
LGFGLRLRFGTKYRWFLRQSFLAPHDPGAFLGFAQRLTGQLGNEQDRTAADEDLRQLLALLMNAFLEDVRRAYRRRWWRPWTARRTGYPVVLLDGITRGNGGYRLLETVNWVRNETGLFDPLLFISGSAEVPPDATPPGAATQQIWDMRDAQTGYHQWCGQFAHDSRTRQPVAWYLCLRCTVGDEAMPATGTLEVPSAPWWSRSTALILGALALVGLAVAAVLVVVGIYQDRETQWRAQHCGLGSDDSRASHLRSVEGECVGLTAEALEIFGQSPELLDVQKVIAKQNMEAEELHRNHAIRPLVTVAYISELSASGDILPSEVERLQGIAARQRRQLDGNGADPLVRILFANAGHEMRHGTQVATMLAGLMEQDRSIVGAIGLAVSSKSTVDTIRVLGGAGIPMIAAPLTADGLEKESPLYYQVAPQNRREAQVAARYARHRLLVTGPVIVVSSGHADDLYDTTLAAAALEAFRNEHFVVEQRIYTPIAQQAAPDRPDPRALGQRLCGTNGLLFYTGRPADFTQLLDGINLTCGSSPPRILAGDDISRYVADGKSQELFPRIPFDHMAIAVGGQNCYSGGDLNVTLLKLFEKWCGKSTNSFLTDDASTAYDALTVITTAVTTLRGTRITPGAVWHMISQITGSTRIDGASGIIDFGRDGAQIPLNKFLAVMRVSGTGVPQVQATCGEFRDYTPATWCP